MRLSVICCSGTYLQDEYLEQMEKDAVSLEMCTKEIRFNLNKKDISRSMRACISHGQDSALRCKQWYAHVKPHVLAMITRHGSRRSICYLYSIC